MFSVMAKRPSTSISKLQEAKRSDSAFCTHRQPLSRIGKTAGRYNRMALDRHARKLQHACLPNKVGSGESGRCRGRIWVKEPRTSVSGHSMRTGDEYKAAPFVRTGGGRARLRNCRFISFTLPYCPSAGASTRPIFSHSFLNSSGDIVAFLFLRFQAAAMTLSISISDSGCPCMTS